MIEISLQILIGEYLSGTKKERSPLIYVLSENRTSNNQLDPASDRVITVLKENWLPMRRHGSSGTPIFRQMRDRCRLRYTLVDE